jgi:Flp pilus assembly protein CpaB
MIFALWCLANVAFATWWESRNIEFLFPLWVGALMLAALASAALDRRVLIAAVLLVAGVNLAAAFLPQHDWPARYRVAEALARHEQLAKDDVLVTEELNTVAYLRYFDSVDVRFQPGAVSAAMHASEPVARVRTSLDSALASGARVYTTELDEHGRLREIARWFAPLGRSGYDGAVERDIDLLYQGLDTSEQPVPGARRVRKAPAPR